MANQPTAILAQPRADDQPLPPFTPTSTVTLIQWLALAERWPEIRFAMQGSADAKTFATRLGAIRRFYRGVKDPNPETETTFLDTLPSRADNPALGGFLEGMGKGEPGSYLAIETLLQGAGM